MSKPKNKKINFRDRKILFVDLETTGLIIKKHEIVEVGCLVVDGRSLKLIGKYYARVNPEHIETADPEGLKISGFSKERWKKAKPLGNVLKDIIGLAPGAMVAGWKVDFDWWMLEKNFQKFGLKHKFDYHLIDVISLAYAYFRKKEEPEDLSLSFVCKLLGVPIHEKHHEGVGHNAMDDIMATYRVFKKLIELLG